MYDEEHEQRRELLDLVRAAPPRVSTVVWALLRSVGETPEEGEGTDLAHASRELVAALHFAVTRTLLLPDDMGQKVRWYEYTRSLPVQFFNDVEWIRHRRKGSLSTQLSQRIIRCRLNHWPMHRIVYVRPAQHHGTSVGLGAFAMIHLKRGHLLFQFTGRVVVGGRCFLSKHQMRQDYCIEFQHGVDSLTVTPLTDDDHAPHPDNVAAFINEPSAPPWGPGDTASVAGRRATIRRYDYRTGTYEVEYARGSMERVDALDLDPHPSQPTAQRVFEANVFWYDFPVPLASLYTPRRGAPRGPSRPGADGDGGVDGSGLLVYRRTASRTATVRWPVAAFLKAFNGYSDRTGIYKMERRVALETLARGHMVYMAETVFRGLERYGVVMGLGANRDGERTTVTVRHVVTANTLWRLPRTVLASKVARCAACQRLDDPSCERCTVVPFPLVYACRDIYPGQELLCLYSTRIRSRGVPCRTPLQDEDLLPRWDGH